MTGARVGEQPRRAHTGCAEREAGGGWGPRPHRPSTVEKELVCFPKALSGLRPALQEDRFPARWKQDAHLPRAPAPASSATAPARSSLKALPRRWKPPLGRPATSICPRAARLVFQGRKHCRRHFQLRSWREAPPAGLAPSPEAPGVCPTPGRLPGASLSIQTCRLSSRGVQRAPEPS